MAGIDLGKMKEPPHDTPMHTHPHFDMGCDCADDQIPVFSKVGRGLRGDSAKLELVEDGDLNTYVRGLTYDAATGGWSTEWTSGNINAGKVSMSYMFFPNDDPKTFTMTFRLERPGRQMWEWTTPRIPYTWDEAGHDPISAGPSRGLFVKHIDPASDWFDKMTLPEGMTPEQREGIGAPLNWNHDSSALPFSQATPYVNTLTWGVHPQFEGDVDNTLHGDIPVLRDEQEARIIGITEEALHRLLTQDPEQLPLEDDLSYTYSGIPVTIVGDTILELFKNTADDIYSRIGSIETGIGGLWYKTIPCLLVLMKDSNSESDDPDVLPEDNLAIPEYRYDSSTGYDFDTLIQDSGANSNLLAYRPGTITITWSDKLPYFNISMKCGTVEVSSWSSIGSNSNSTAAHGVVDGSVNYDVYRRSDTYAQGKYEMRIGPYEYIVPCWLERQVKDGVRYIVPIDLKSDTLRQLIGKSVTNLSMDCETFSQSTYSSSKGNALEFTGVGTMLRFNNHPWYNDPSHYVARRIYMYMVMRTPGAGSPRIYFDFNRNYSTRFETNIKEYQGGE